MLFVNTTLSKLNKSIISNLRIYSLFRNVHTTQAVLLYSPSALGVDGYLNTRKKCTEQLALFSDKFRAKMTDFVGNEKQMIFTEDLKNMVHIAEPSDVNLVLNMVKKFNTQTSEYRFGSFVFGPVVMRMFHFLDAPVEALQSFNDPANGTFYEQLMTYQILMDLLFRHEMFNEMYEVFERAQEKQLNMTKYPKYCVVLVLAAAYKQNTPQSLEYASKLWSDMVNTGVTALRRASGLFAGLALNQNAPHIALEATAAQKQQHYVTIRNIKAMALTDLGRIEDALQILRSVLDVDAKLNEKHTYFEETIDKVRQGVEKSGKKDLLKEFERIELALRDRDYVDDQTLEKLLLSEIQVRKQTQDASRPFTNNRNIPYGHRHRQTTRY